jgi:hypothetical protein
MPQVQLRHLDACLVKIEAAEGTDAVPVATNAIQLLEPPTITFGQEIQNLRPDVQNQQLEEAFPLPPSAKWVEISGRWQVRGKGAAYAAYATGAEVPEIHPILAAAGMSQTGSFGAGTESWVYDTAITGTKTCTWYYWHGLESGVYVKHVLTAARTSKLRFYFSVGAPAIVEFTMRGLYNAVTDTTIVAPTYFTTAPGRFNAASSWQYGAFAAAVLKEADVTIENTLTPRLNANAPDALAGWVLTNRKIRTTAQFEAMRIADFDPRGAKWAAVPGVQDTLAIKHNQITQYNRMKIDADKATIVDAPSYNDDNGRWLDGISATLTPEGTNRCKITFD